MPETVLDATGLRCPLPVLRARKTLRDVAPGGALEIRATDPSAPADFEAFCREAGHTLLGIEKTDGIYLIRLRKRATSDGRARTAATPPPAG